MGVKILHPGLYEPKQFPSLLEAFEYVVEHGKQSCFMVQQKAQLWENGAELFNGMRKLFAPVEE